MQLHKDSHLDHNLTARQLAHLLAKFADRNAFFVETFELPEDLGTLPCSLYGPIVGDHAVREELVLYQARGDRAWPSRLIEWVPRDTRTITVIGGPHDGAPCVLFTAYGGPAAPREPDDPAIPAHELEASRAFWREHALSSL